MRNVDCNGNPWSEAFKAYVLINFYCPARILEKSLEALRATSTFPRLELIGLHQHYPVDKANNRLKIEEICRHYNVRQFDAGSNLGMHGGLNYMCQQIQPTDSDILILHDADSKVLTSGWDTDLVRCLKEGYPRVAWAALMNPRSKGDLERNGYDQCEWGWRTRSSVTVSVSAFPWWFIRSCPKGFDEPLHFYGHFETQMWAQIQAQNKQWVFLPQHPEDEELRYMHDRQYIAYKWDYSHLKNWTGDFESWLAARGDKESNAPAQIP